MSEAVREPKTKGHLRRLEQLVRQEIPAPPIVVQIELGRSVFEMQADPEHANPMGTLHGGVLCDVGDAAMGTAFASTLEDDESFTTLDLDAKYFKPVWNAKLRAVARVTKRTRSLGLVECEVEDEKGSLVAKLFSTCMVLRGEEAKGR